MNSLVKATRAWCDEDSLWLDLSDGRTLGVPLAWFPRLMRASPEERKKVTISTRGLTAAQQIWVANAITALD